MKTPKFCPFCGNFRYLFFNPTSTRCHDCGEAFTVLDPEEFEELEACQGELSTFGADPEARAEILKRSDWLDTHAHEIGYLLRQLVDEIDSGNVVDFKREPILQLITDLEALP